MNNGIGLSFTLKTEQLLKLSQSAQKRLRSDWDGRNGDSYAYIPTKIKGSITIEEGNEWNKKLGGFAQDFLKKILKRSTEDDICRRKEKGRGILAVGAGKGFDSFWVREAVEVNLRPIWLDVSSVACRNIIPILEQQFDSIPESNKKDKLRPLVNLAELRSVLVDPESTLLDFNSIEIWYMCRVLEIMSVRTAKIVLRQIGKYLAMSQSNSIVIVDAVLDYNPNYTGLKNSRLDSIQFFLKNLTAGATSVGGDRLIAKVCLEEKFLYFDKQFSALEIKVGL